MRNLMLGAAAAAAAIVSACAHGGAAPKGHRSVTLTPQQIVEARRAAFRMSGADFQLMRTAAEKGVELRSLAGPARSLSQWAAILPASVTPKSMAAIDTLRTMTYKFCVFSYSVLATSSCV